MIKETDLYIGNEKVAVSVSLKDVEKLIKEKFSSSYEVSYYDGSFFDDLDTVTIHGKNVKIIFTKEFGGMFSPDSYISVALMVRKPTYDYRELKSIHRGYESEIIAIINDNIGFLNADIDSDMLKHSEVEESNFDTIFS